MFLINKEYIVINIMNDSTTNTFSPQYIQTASMQPPGSQHNISFTNLSSQQQTPGSLVAFFQAQDQAMQPMPFTHSDLDVDHGPVARMYNEKFNVSTKPKTDTLTEFFHYQDMEKNAHYRTNEQRRFNVPDYLLEARADEMFS